MKNAATTTYQANGDNQNIVAAADVASGIQEDQEKKMGDGENYPTVTLVPSDDGQGDMSYVFVVQEDPQAVVNFNIKSEKNNDDVYMPTFEEEGDDVGKDAKDVAPDPKSKAPKSARQRFGSRPHFNCNFCTYSSHRRYLLLRHMKSHSAERPHKCGVCERGFKTMASLKNHENMHNGVKPHVCTYCETPFTTSGELVRHVRYKHTHEKPHRCTECDYASVELSKLRRHERCHTGERPYQCPHCTYASPDTFKLKRHLRTHTGEKPYQCDICKMCFTQSNSLKAHKLIHNLSEKPVYKCELCPAKCGRKTDLRIHMQKLHASDHPLECKWCGKSFPDRYSCKVHSKTHEGEKRFKCDLCPYATTAVSHLRSHLLKHTDEKPFACDECDQSFRQKQLLRRHENIYHNPDYVPKPPKEKTHSCHECDRTFARKGNLIRHLAIHDPHSGHKERALALKLGREKRVKFMNGQMKVLDEERDTSDAVKMGLTSNELRRGELVPVSDGDGQQYVVLEVIQLEDGTEQVAAVALDFMNMGGDAEQIDDNEDYEEVETDPKSALFKDDRKHGIKLEQEVDTCFGFDEEEDAEGEESASTHFVNVS